MATDWALLRELTEAPGVSGYEAPVREVLTRYLGALAARIGTDNLGSLIAERPGAAARPRVMLAAHMDEIGFMVSHVDDGVGWILSRFFVEKAFSAAAKQFGDTIITDIKTEFAKKLQATKWMDKVTTAQAINKVHNIIQKIGYPTKSPNIMDPPSLERYYESVNVSSDAFLQNALSVRRFAVDDEWSALGKPVDRDQWGMTVS